MDNKVEEVFGVNINREPVDIDRNTIYGFAYMTESTRGRWICNVGSFENVHGIFTGLMQARDDAEEMEADFFNFAFFELDKEMRPVEAISRARINRDLAIFMGHPGTHSIIMTDLSILENENVEPLEFEF